MTDLQHESTWIHLLRGGVLLMALVVVPGTAVCWNLISKDVFQPERENFCDFTQEEADLECDENTPDRFALNHGDEEPERTNGGLSETDEAQHRRSFEDAIKPVALEPGRVRQMGVAESVDGCGELPIPTSFNRDSALQAAHLAEAAPKVAQNHDETVASNRNFSILEGRLKQLGAKYYRMEKWGSRGDLFRFSCYVSSSTSRHYQKHFQAIDPDELRVMENVIRDIETWQSNSARSLHHENRP